MYFENNISAINGRNVMTSKTCYKCKQVLEIIHFGKLKSSSDGHRYDCKNCRKQYAIENKAQIKQKQHEYYQNNKLELQNKNKSYRLANTDKINEQRKEYRSREEVKLHIKQKNAAYLPIRKQQIKEKRKSNMNFKLSEIMRSKIHKMIKGHPTSYKQLIGCDEVHLIKWLEFRFDDNMNWNNFGTYWQIDHVLPINKFNFANLNEQKICFHWTNLQPLNALENRQKSDKLMLHHYFNNVVNVNRFNSKYNNFLGYQIVSESLQWLRCELRYGNNSPYNSDISDEIDNSQPSS